MSDPYLDLSDPFVDQVLAAFQATLESDLDRLHGQILGTNCSPSPQGELTLETLRDVQRRLDMAEADHELNVFLSDNWQAYKLLKQGGRVVEVNGTYFVCGKEFFEGLKLREDLPWKR